MTAQTLQHAAGAARGHILDAAQVRFVRFGYHKTTMAEIADDVGMSAANLYRYFDNKQDIAAACAERIMAERFERLRAIVRDPRRTASAKLAAYAETMVAHTHELADPGSRIGELVEFIARERQGLAQEKIATHFGLIAEILGAGVERGEFAVTDIATAASCVYSAFMAFDVPLFIGLLTREEFDARARGVTGLLIDGLRGPARRGA